MGAWGAGLYSNDTAEDLKTEYLVAFWYYDVDTALAKIDEYVRREITVEDDEEEWCCYMYSLADFMWKKGILTDEIKEKVIGMIDSGFGLEVWREGGEKVLRERERVLAKFRQKLTTPLPPKKKIKPDVHAEKIFKSGDLIAIRLQTAGKHYIASYERPLTDEEFHALDGKYVLMQKVTDEDSWESSVVPEVHDYWPVFRLFDGVYDDVPYDIDIGSLKDSKMTGGRILSPLFFCEGSMFYFKRRGCIILGNYPDAAAPYEEYPRTDIFFGVINNYYDPDSSFLAAMGKEIVCGEYAGDMETIYNIVEDAVGYNYDYSVELSGKENDRIINDMISAARAGIDGCLSRGGKLYSVSFGVTAAVATVEGGRIDHIFIAAEFSSYGFEAALVKYIAENTEGHLYTVVPDGMYGEEDGKKIIEALVACGLTKQSPVPGGLMMENEKI